MKKFLIMFSLVFLMGYAFGVTYVVNPYTGKIEIAGGIVPGGNDTEIQFNDGGNIGGDGGLVYNKITNKLSNFGSISTTGAFDAGSVTVNGALTLTPSADQSLANDAAVVVADGINRVVGNGGAVVLDTDPAIADGSADGQFIIIQGTSDSNTVQIADAVNTQLAGGVAFTLGLGDTMQFIWDSGMSLWLEVSRSDN